MCYFEDIKKGTTTTTKAGKDLRGNAVMMSVLC